MYLLRHGATANNLAQPPVLQGRKQNPGLSPEGQRQAEAAAGALADRSIAAVYSSPMVRAVETAEYFARDRALTPQTVDALIEVDVGRWEGRDWNEIAASEPDAYRQFMEDPAAHGYSGGESLGEVSERVLPAMSSLLDAHPGEAIIVIAHNVVNRVYLAELLHLPTSQARSIAQANCGINVIRRRDKSDNVVTLNSVLHLGKY
jgi:broad specificity phosphatase PhoE